MLIETVPTRSLESGNKTRSNVLCDSPASNLDGQNAVVKVEVKSGPGSPLSIPHLLAGIPKGRGGIKQLRCGGIEAIPVISGADVKVHNLPHGAPDRPTVPS